MGYAPPTNDPHAFQARLMKTTLRRAREQARPSGTQPPQIARRFRDLTAGLDIRHELTQLASADAAMLARLDEFRDQLAATATADDLAALAARVAELETTTRARAASATGMAAGWSVSVGATLLEVQVPDPAPAAGTVCELALTATGATQYPGRDIVLAVDVDGVQLGTLNATNVGGGTGLLGLIDLDPADAGTVFTGALSGTRPVTGDHLTVTVRVAAGTAHEAQANTALAMKVDATFTTPGSTP